MLHLNFSTFPVLYTERLVLRATTLQDADALSSIRSDKSVNQFLDRPKLFSEAEAENRIRKIENEIKNAECIEWILQYKDNANMLGSICYWNIVTKNDKAEIGYEMHSQYFGKGIMQEAIKCIIDYGFNVMQLKTIEAFPLAANSRSIRLLEKNNFTRDFNIEQYNLSENEKQTTAVYVLRKRNDAL